MERAKRDNLPKQDILQLIQEKEILFESFRRQVSQILKAKD